MKTTAVLEHRDYIPMWTIAIKFVHLNFYGNNADIYQRDFNRNKTAFNDYFLAKEKYEAAIPDINKTNDLLQEVNNDIKKYQKELNWYKKLSFLVYMKKFKAKRIKLQNDFEEAVLYKNQLTNELDKLNLLKRERDRLDNNLHFDELCEARDWLQSHGFELEHASYNSAKEYDIEIWKREG